jgi:cytochrome c biogenesis protein CcmG/thiol:disulfide interchange protein DsbE
VIGLVAVVGLLAILAVAALGSGRSLSAGGEAPGFRLVTFDGDAYSSSDLKGKVVVVNFWASWCETCEDEAADLEAVWQDYRDRGVVVLGVDYVDTESAAHEYLEQYGITYPNGPDVGGAISRAYGVSGVPETVVIAPDGTVAGIPQRGAPGPVESKVSGPIVDDSMFTPDDLRALIDQLLEDDADGT